MERTLLKIALDYDETYSRDPEFWDMFIQLCRARKYDVRIVTVRDERFDRSAELVAVEKKLPVIYTRGVAKQWYCSHFADGFNPEIWIDDRPKSILENSSLAPDDLAKWREERKDGPQVKDVTHEESLFDRLIEKPGSTDSGLELEDVIAFGGDIR